MKRITLILIFLLLVNFIKAQNQSNNWYFGQFAGITFSTNPPTALTGGQLNTGEGCTSISDPTGKLLFYSDGISVWDSTHAIMPNGTGLLGDPSSTQSGVIVPAPGSSTLFYLITAPLWGSLDPLAYSIVDMTLHNGLGDITVKNVPLLDSSAEKLTAVYNHNGTDVWIVAHGCGNNNFYAYLLTSGGMSTVPVVSSTGNYIGIEVKEIGYLKASPCGNQLAMADWNYGNIASTLELFDFNDSTGVVSNGLQIGEFNVASGVYGVEFSPDNSKLYASVITPGLVVQYDLLAGSPAAIIASMDTVGISPGNFNGALQTGPDGRIYLVKNSDSWLACIPNPNQLGSLCGYIEDFVSLGAAAGQIGLPDFFSSMFCNIPSGVNANLHPEDLLIYPNPFYSNLTVSVKNKNIKTVTIMIYDALGQTVYNNHETNYGNSYTKTVELSFLVKGIYFFDLRLDEERMVKKIIKE